MPEQDQETKCTVLPPVEAEGAANMGANPGTKAGGTPTQKDVETRTEGGRLLKPSNPSRAGAQGNRTGGMPAEDAVLGGAPDAEAQTAREREIRERNTKD